jgi:hypothetical protein
MPEQWTKSIIVRIYTEGSTTDCSNYTGTSLLFRKWNQLGALFILCVFCQFYLCPLHVLNLSMSIIGRNSCIYVTLDTCYSVFFSHYLIKGKFLENPVIEFKMRFIPTNSVWNISHPKKNWGRYDQKTFIYIYIYIGIHVQYLYI